MKPLTDSTPIATVEGSTKPLVIKFEANWCQPCKAMKPMMADIERQLGDKVDFYSANVEHCTMIAQRYKINQIPALVAIQNGAVTAVRTGAASKAELMQWIKTALQMSTT